MKAIFALAFLAITAQAAVLKDPMTIEALSDDHVEYINSLNTTWTAGHNFKGLKIEQLKRLCGAVLDNENSPLAIKSVGENFNAAALPKEFDSRKKWPECAETIKHVRDQGSCGSCWAVAAAGAITDRVCIKSNGQKKTPLSAQDMTSCCTTCFEKEGCQGGNPTEAWLYWLHNGLPTGAEYGDKNTCAPYLVEPCEHHVEGSRKKCGKIVPTPACTKSCSNSGFEYESEKSYGKIAYRSNPWPAEIKAEILENGPVEAGFNVYEDFFLYKDGIYQVTTDKLVGGHAVVIYGWGEENGVKYWKAKNSWNTDWGNKGFFNIEERSAQIHTFITSGIPKE